MNYKEGDIKDGREIIQECETFRVLAATKDEKEKKATDIKGYEVDLGNGKMAKLTSFTEVRDKEKGEVKMLFKIKTEEDGQKMFLYYIPDSTKGEDLERCKEAIGQFSIMFKGLEVQDMRDQFKHLLNEMPSIENRIKLREAKKDE